jgi:hypothetical protein
MMKKLMKLANPARSHLIQDLQPYTCTAPVCPEGDGKPLNTWEEWILHEQIHHRMEYICSDHPAQAFTSRERYIDHIVNAHSDGKGELLVSQEIDKSARLSPKPIDKCPLCSYSADNWQDMDKHLGFHLETLSLLGLPLATGLEKDEQEMTSLQLEGVTSNSELEFLEDGAREDDTEWDLLEPKGTHTPPGEMLTMDSLSQFQERTLNARNGHEAVIELLHDMSGANDRTEDEAIDEESDIKRAEESSCKLLLAAKDGDEAVVRLLVSKGKVEVDARDSDGRTPLSWAAESGHETVARLLVEEGADLESQNIYFRTPLSRATESGHTTVVNLLVKYGADVNGEGAVYGNTLCAASYIGHDQMVKLLLDKAPMSTCRVEETVTHSRLLQSRATSR